MSREKERSRQMDRQKDGKDVNDVKGDNEGKRRHR